MSEKLLDWENYKKAKLPLSLKEKNMSTGEIPEAKKNP